MGESLQGVGCLWESCRGISKQNCFRMCVYVCVRAVQGVHVLYVCIYVQLYCDMTCGG